MMFGSTLTRHQTRAREEDSKGGRHERMGNGYDLIALADVLLWRSLFRP